ncbi:hypothetical protein [Streptomyces sp. NPDC058279]|uniref:hypothetical protein n=1 Tax=Streptomyces sp. NPDC058279 TaxID=3346418 RepID=UPI0036E65AA1
MRRVSVPGDASTIAHVFTSAADGHTEIWVLLTDESEQIYFGGWRHPRSSRPAQNFDDFLSKVKDSHVGHHAPKAGGSSPTVDDHLFVAGWETWGPGIPAPLLQRAKFEEPSEQVWNLPELLADHSFWSGDRP